MKTFIINYISDKTLVSTDLLISLWLKQTEKNQCKWSKTERATLKYKLWGILRKEGYHPVSKRMWAK